MQELLSVIYEHLYFGSRWKITLSRFIDIVYIYVGAPFFCLNVHKSLRVPFKLNMFTISNVLFNLNKLVIIGQLDKLPHVVD